MYCLRLFIVVLQDYIVYDSVYCYYCGVFIETYVYAKFRLDCCCVSELHGYLCPYRNVLPEAVYCCFTRTTLFTNMLFHGRYGYLAVRKVSFLNSFWLLRYAGRN